MPTERKAFSINDSRANVYQDIPANVGLNPYFSLHKTSPTCIKPLHVDVKAIKSFSEETCKRVVPL